jgi:CubicO group peptidase (beta-lactamase class C family)
VERVAGVPFDDYIDRNLLQPLGMARTTFRQPLPAALAAGMSVGYRYADGRFEPKPFEIAAGAEPAASVSATATDMAKFMIVHLANGAVAGGGRILAESTAVRMLSRLFGGDPRIPGFAYGFYEQSRNGRRMIGHGGDTEWFHSSFPASRSASSCRSTPTRAAE